MEQWPLAARLITCSLDSSQNGDTQAALQPGALP